MDPTQAAALLADQQQILRDIRDELRYSRGESGPSVGTTAGSTPRANNTFVRAQMASDAALSGQWNQLSWSSAYRADIRTSLVGDISGAFGFGGAPNTLTQHEFQGVARESLYMRAQSIVGNVIAPGSMGALNSVADDIFRFSPRFARAGDAGVGMLGVGVDRSAARFMAQDIERSAIRDLRMTTADYGTVVSNGLQSGQFDLVEGAKEFRQQIQQIATITSDLTRMTRMTVEEVSRSMGALRQMGISDPAAQARTILQLDASARVAGVTSAEMATAATAAMHAGLPMGVAASTSAGLAASNIAMVRSMSAMMPAGVLAAGGGALGVSASITNAQQQFLASSGGYYALRGGLGTSGDLFSASTAGLLGTGGTVGGILGAEADRLGFMQGLTPAQGRQAFLGSVQSQMRMVGVNDMVGTDARNMAFGMLRGQMGDAAALTFADANFTSGGIRTSSQARLREMEYMGERDRANEYSRFMEETGGGGFAMRRVVSSLGSQLANARNKVMDAPSWIKSLFVTPTRDMEGQMLARSHGSVTDRADVGAMVDALHGSSPVPQTMMLSGRATGREWGQVIGMYAGGAAGFAAGFGAPLGPVTGLVGAAIGNTLGGWIGDAISPAEQVPIRGEDVGTYMAIRDTMGGNNKAGYARGRHLVATSQTANGSSLFANTDFLELTRKMGQGAIGGEASEKFMQSVKKIAAATGEDASSIAAAAKAMGMGVELSWGYGQFDTKAKMTEAYSEVLGGTGLSSSNFNFAITENAMGVRDYLKALDSGDAHAEGRALLRLNELGFEGGAGIDQLRENYGKFQKSGRSGDLLGALEAYGREGASIAVTQRLDTVARLADSLVGRDGAQNEAARKDIARTQGDRKQFLGMLSGGPEGSALRAALRQSGDPFFAQMMGIGEANLLGTSNADIHKQFTLLDPADIAEQRKFANGDNKKFATALQLTLAGSEGAAAAEEGSRDSQNQLETVRVLERIADKIGPAKA